MKLFFYYFQSINPRTSGLYYVTNDDGWMIIQPVHWGITEISILVAYPCTGIYKKLYARKPATKHQQHHATIKYSENKHSSISFTSLFTCQLLHLVIYHFNMTLFKRPGRMHVMRITVEPRLSKSPLFETSIIQTLFQILKSQNMI